MKKTSIMLGMPTVYEACTASIASLAFSLGQISQMPGSRYDFGPKFASGNSSIAWPVDFQRNRIVKAFLDSRHDWLWFIDSDTLPTENSTRLLTLMERAQVIAGIYPIPSDAREPLVWSVYDGVERENRVPWSDGCLRGAFQPKMLPGDEEEPVIEAAAAATGCMLIHRSVLEDVRLPFAEPDADGIPSVFKTVSDRNGKVAATDDMDFCHRVTEHLKVPILVDTSVRWGHQKSIDVRRMFGAMELSFEIGARYGAAQHTAVGSPLVS